MGKIHSNVFFILFFIYIYIFTHTRNINLLLSDHVAFSLPETTLKSDDKYYFFLKLQKSNMWKSKGASVQLLVKPRPL